MNRIVQNSELDAIKHTVHAENGTHKNNYNGEYYLQKDYGANFWNGNLTYQLQFNMTDATEFPTILLFTDMNYLFIIKYS